MTKLVSLLASVESIKISVSLVAMETVTPVSATNNPSATKSEVSRENGKDKADDALGDDLPLHGNHGNLYWNKHQQYLKL